MAGRRPSTAPADHSAVGKRVQQRRRQLGLTTAEFAARLECSVGRVYQIECYGVGNLDAVAQLARALDEDPRWIAFGDYTQAEADEERMRSGRARDRWLAQLGA